MFMILNSFSKSLTMTTLFYVPFGGGVGVGVGVVVGVGVGMGEDVVPLIDDCRCDKYPSLNHNST
jgi:hypothetical protein